MRRWKLSNFVINSCVTAALLVGCGGSQPPVGAPDALPQTSALATRTNRTHYKVLYSFGALPDGNDPRASLIDAGGTLYGTTFAGGANTCSGGYTSSPYYFSCGTVFTITTGGKERVLYSFGPAPDGNTPGASLLDAGGTLYGTTTKGGSYTCGYQYDYHGCGTVFSVTTSGTEKVLYNFGAQDGNVGVEPDASLIDVKGTLYGTTAGGGVHSCGIYTGNCGTIFSITPSGTERVLHSFRDGSHPHFPRGSLRDAGGVLYGTTSEGGPYSCREAYYGCGTVFSITLGGSLKVLYDFGNGTDGKVPNGNLIEVKGRFYGTTSQGGVYGSGTVFSITSAGTEKVLHSFGGSGNDGEDPAKGLVELNGKLYGTTQNGGTDDNGTVFSITPSGTEKVLHSFSYGTDGSAPLAGLTDVNGTLYGTTSSGGTNNTGTVFSLKP